MSFLSEDRLPAACLVSQLVNRSVFTDVLAQTSGAGLL